MESRPSLTWLRAFEAAARLSSFKRAAAELNVSPSTISHQVRDLEATLGYPLFSRGGTRLQLTEEGRALARPLTHGFGLIHQAVDNTPQKREFVIGAFPFLGSEVLLPAANEIKAVCGLDRMTLHTTTALSGLSHLNASERLDAIIRYGPKPDADDQPFAPYLSIPLFPIRLVPIFGKDGPKPGSIEDLVSWPYVGLAGPFDAWGSWASSLGIDLPERQAALVTDNYHAAVLAVERGEGCCLGVFPFLSKWVSDGRIESLEQYAGQIEEYAYLVFAHHNEHSDVIQHLADWLRNSLK